MSRWSEGWPKQMVFENLNDDDVWIEETTVVPLSEAEKEIERLRKGLVRARSGVLRQRPDEAIHDIDRALSPRQEGE